ncbi:hypothetical protein HGI30_06690 [Paenibacillus albicereus]|uniref:Pilus assembly protein n=1 Tax=Paenibacillus albicereus TaxID=2726185 RepID=A0A6H2GV45_9BACL|nr:hypothetical protein [Paenibacillus albicereus]QJC51262.1 hypothetical protein HGI30_06690 [Paenibacillus albicereus]
MLLKRLAAGAEGSLALEAASVFPLLLAVTFAWMIAALFIFQGSVLQSGAARAAEAASLHWDNSKREESGLPPAGQDDGLYGRLSQDSLLQGLFGLAAGETTASIALPAAPSSNGSLAATKLSKAAARLSPELRGEFAYRREGLERRTEARLRLPVAAAEGLAPAVRASAVVTDPVEFIRSVDLVRYYTAKFRSSRDVQPSSAGKALTEYASGRP